MISYFSEHQKIDNIKTLHAIYKQIIDLAEVSFEGEPWNGLQIMGVLESRVLDFETVIITSVNEGKFPAGKSTNSFIPYDVKREYGLPTYKEKDAIYTYHFYHLLQRAKNIYLIYNVDSDGFDSGEISRFITQLEVEKKSKHTITHYLYNAMVPAKVSNTMLVEKTESILARLQEMAQAGFSPSTLTTYLRNPIQFYFQRILRIKEVDEVEENVAVNTLGTIIHGALEVLYTPYIGKILIEKDVTDVLLHVDLEIVFQKFKEIYKEGEIKKGKNLLAFEVAKRNGMMGRRPSWTASSAQNKPAGPQPMMMTGSALDTSGRSSAGTPSSVNGSSPISTRNRNRTWRPLASMLRLVMRAYGA